MSWIWKSSPAIAARRMRRSISAALAQLARVELAELILKTLQPFHFRIDREPAVVADFAVVLMETEGHALERPGCQVAADEVEHQFVEIRVRFLRLGRLGQSLEWP